MPKTILRGIFALGVAALVLLLVFHDGVIDRAISDAFYDHTIRQFVAKENALIDLVLYRGAKVAMTVFAFALAGLAIWQIRAGHPVLRLRHLAIGVLGSILIPLVIATLKNKTGVECPWSLTQYGGAMPYMTLWESLSSPDSAGRCFPAGHAGGGFILFPWAVCYFRANTRLALLLAYGGVFFGGLMGLTRIAQGAHFFSHTLWAAWVALCITLILSAIFLPKIHATQAEQTHA